MFERVPDVSVVIPTFNRREFTAEAIGTAITQRGVGVEVIVVDDGSADDTCEWIRKHYPEVLLFESPHRGAGAARNQGLLAARGRYLKFFDSDDLLIQGSLEKQTTFADLSNAEVCYGDWEFFGDLGAAEVGSQPQRIMGRPADIIVALLESWWGPPSIYLVRREFIATRNILWDENLERNQDMDFMLQIALHGGRFDYDPGIVTCKRVHDLGGIMDTGTAVYGRHCELVADKVLARLKETERLTDERKQALADLFWHASRLIKQASSSDYRRVLTKILSLYPRYVPQCTTYASPKMKWTIKTLGMRNAERLFGLISVMREFRRRAINATL
jgi:glycosyltransferase involved in cell wall biosynthesis